MKNEMGTKNFVFNLHLTDSINPVLFTLDTEICVLHWSRLAVRRSIDLKKHG